MANAADQSSFEEIRSIAQGMDLSRQDFLDAQLAIPREDPRDSRTLVFGRCMDASKQQCS